MGYTVGRMVTDSPRGEVGDMDDDRSLRKATLPPALLETLFNSVSEGVFAVDLGFHIIAVNDAALKTLGLGRSQAIGIPYERAFRANLQGEDCPLRRAMADDEPQYNNSTLIRGPRNRQLPVTLSAAPVHAKDGQLIGGIVTIVDLAAKREHFRQLDRGRPLGGIVSSDPAMRRLFDVLPTIAGSATTVMINGETGTGKNLIARAIHALSARADRPMITVNCAALPETLLEAELFGHRAGAFTGAHKDRTGRLAAAEGGTLFLDEVGDIPLAMQVKLLRVLQERVFERLGEQEPIPCNVRFITATHRNLEEMIAAGTFRRDLFYRINVLNLEIPPLRDRKGDIPQLIQRFMERLGQSRGKPIQGVSSGALEILMAHNYPGNVRELENIIEHAWVMCRGHVLNVEHLPPALRATRATSPPGRGSFADMEARYLLEALESHDWHRGRAAAALGMHRTTLQRKIRKLGITLPEKDGRHN